MSTLLGYRCEALVLIGPAVSGPALAALAALAAGVPVVVAARRVSRPGVDVVRTADAAGVIQAVEYLAGLGHRRIDHVDGGRAPGAADRRRGYRAAVRRLGLAGRVLAAGPAEDDGARAGRELLDGPLPTAVICYNDRVALGLMDVMIRAGVPIPEAVSVVGFDDTPLAGLAHISLTSVAQDVDQMARLAVTRLVSRLEPGRVAPCGPGERDIVLPPRLVVRGSTGAPGPDRPAGPVSPRAC